MTTEQRAKQLWLVSHTAESETYWKHTKTFGAFRAPRASGMAERWSLFRLLPTTAF